MIILIVLNILIRVNLLYVSIIIIIQCIKQIIIIIKVYVNISIYSFNIFLFNFVINMSYRVNFFNQIN